jgi:hypothetical protein
LARTPGLNLPHYPSAATIPNGRPSTGYGLSGPAGGQIAIRINTSQALLQVKGAVRITGKAWEATKAAHTKLGNTVAKQALANLEATLIPARRRVNEANRRRHRGIRAALQDPRNVVVDSYGRFWGVGDPRIFAEYKALAYYRVIERGGGFQGRIWGLLIDEAGQPTVGPTGKSTVSSRAHALVAGANIANTEADKLGQRRMSKYGTPMKMSAGNASKVAGLRAQANANIAQARAIKYGKWGQRKSTGRTGQPLADWQKWGGAAAAGIKTGGPTGWWFVVRNKVQAKNYLGDAMASVMNSDLPETIYNAEFRAKGIPFRYVKGSVENSFMQYQRMDARQ